jgi:hypothetical protein
MVIGQAGKQQQCRASNASRTTTQGPTFPAHQTVSFNPPLHKVNQSARRLYLVLERARVCGRHEPSDIFLRLDKRLNPRNISEGPEQAFFALMCKLCFNVARRWMSVEITVPLPNNNQRVNTANPIPPRSLCSLVDYGSATLGTTRFFLGEHDRIIRQQNQGSPPLSATFQPNRFISLKNLLGKNRNSNSLYRVPTIKQSISLGSEIVSAVLQLSATPWLDRVCGYETLYFAGTAESVNASKGYVPMTSTPALMSAPHTNAYGRYFFVRLGLVLLAIAERATLEQLGFTGGSPTIDAADYDNEMRFLETSMGRARGSIEPAFQTAIDYCIRTFDDRSADIRSPRTQDEIIRGMLEPFETELKRWG